MLGDRPALTPIESFYQRILAGDADEAQDHAERLLKDQSLSTYYDDVAIKALQLAANDARRGVLNHEQLERVKSTIKVLVRGLDDQDDKPPLPSKTDGSVMGQPEDQRDPPQIPAPLSITPATDGPSPWLEGSTVMCIAGRAPLDEAASAMLVQLLGKHGIGARLVAYDDVSRERIAMANFEGVKMACISYLDIRGNPAHLRYLIQRLRYRLPKDTPILVGLWPPEDSAIRDPTIKSQVGADYCARSLGEAVSFCMKAARNSGHPSSC
jgi:hypothetical protein